MKLLKSMIRFAAITLFAGLLAACGESKNEDMEKVAIEYWQASYDKDADKLVKLINFPETTPDRVIENFKKKVQESDMAAEGKLLNIEVIDAGIEPKDSKKGWARIKFTFGNKDFGPTPVTRLIYTEKHGWLIREDWATQ